MIMDFKFNGLIMQQYLASALAEEIFLVRVFVRTCVCLMV